MFEPSAEEGDGKNCTVCRKIRAAIRQLLCSGIRNNKAR